jgi:hypothetical protein
VKKVILLFALGTLITSIVAGVWSFYVLRAKNEQTTRKSVINLQVDTPEQKAVAPRINAEYQSIYSAYDKLEKEKPAVAKLALLGDVCALYDRLVRYRDLARRLESNEKDPSHYSKGPCSDCGYTFKTQLHGDVVSLEDAVGEITYFFVVEKHKTISCEKTRPEILSLMREYTSKNQR